MKQIYLNEVLTMTRFDEWYNIQAYGKPDNFVDRRIMSRIYNSYIVAYYKSDYDSYKCAKELTDEFNGEMYWILNSKEFVMLKPYHGYYCSTGVCDCGSDELYDTIPVSIVDNKHWEMLYSNSASNDTLIENYKYILECVKMYYTKGIKNDAKANGLVYDEELNNKHIKSIEECIAKCEEALTCGISYNDLLSEINLNREVDFETEIDKSTINFEQPETHLFY